jgi:hypothetical protein
MRAQSHFAHKNCICQSKSGLKDTHVSDLELLHILPLTCLLPDKRLKHVAERIILGILGGQTPVSTEIARQISKDEGET